MDMGRHATEGLRYHHSTTLAYPDNDKTFYVHTDASDVAIGATLSQLDDKEEMRLVACMSKKLNAAECNYPHTNASSLPSCTL